MRVNLVNSENVGGKADADVTILLPPSDPKEDGVGSYVKRRVAEGA